MIEKLLCLCQFGENNVSVNYKGLVADSSQILYFPSKEWPRSQDIKLTGSLSLEQENQHLQVLASVMLGQIYENAA